MSHALSDEQIDAYRNDGYLVLRELIDAPTVNALNSRFEAMVNGVVPLAPEMKIMQDVMVVKGAVAPSNPMYGVNKLFCLENDPELFSYAQHPALIGAVRSLVGDELYTLTSNVFNKPPGIDGRHPMHQDLRYFRLRPPEKIIGVWTALLPALRSTGCLAILPGTHRGDVLPHAVPDWEYVNKGFFGVTGLDLEDRVHIELQPGDTLLFHPLLVHGSGRNTSDTFRRAISVHYAAGDAESPRSDWRTTGFTRRVL